MLPVTLADIGTDFSLATSSHFGPVRPTAGIASLDIDSNISHVLSFRQIILGRSGPHLKLVGLLRLIFGNL